MDLFNKSKNNKSKNLTYLLNIKATKKSTFLTSNIKKTFNYLKQTFIKASIFWHFDFKCYIQTENNPLSYTIGKMFC